MVDGGGAGLVPAAVAAGARGGRRRECGGAELGRALALWSARTGERKPLRPGLCLRRSSKPMIGVVWGLYSSSPLQIGRCRKADGGAARERGNRRHAASDRPRRSAPSRSSGVLPHPPVRTGEMADTCLGRWWTLWHEAGDRSCRSRSVPLWKAAGSLPVGVEAGSKQEGAVSTVRGVAADGLQVADPVCGLGRRGARRPVVPAAEQSLAHGGGDRGTGAGRSPRSFVATRCWTVREPQRRARSNGSSTKRPTICGRWTSRATSPWPQGRRHPLTMLDDHSRYCLELGARADERTLTVQERMTRVFRRHGLPKRAGGGRPRRDRPWPSRSL